MHILTEKNDYTCNFNKFFRIGSENICNYVDENTCNYEQVLMDNLKDNF